MGCDIVKEWRSQRDHAGRCRVPAVRGLTRAAATRVLTSTSVASLHGSVIGFVAQRQSVCRCLVPWHPFSVSGDHCAEPRP
jgi:hypothetical protein